MLRQKQLVMNPGYWRIPNSKTKPFRDWKRWGHGTVNLKQSIEESVDTFFYQIAYDMGIDRLSTWMMKFGFGDYTGIDIREESKANMPTREWKVARFRTHGTKGILSLLVLVKATGQQHQCNWQKQPLY